MAEQNDKFKRVKYLRGLEKFVKSAISGLKREDFDDAQFRARAAKNAEIFRKFRKFSDKSDAAMPAYSLCQRARKAKKPKNLQKRKTQKKL